MLLSFAYLMNVHMNWKNNWPFSLDCLFAKVKSIHTSSRRKKEDWPTGSRRWMVQPTRLRKNQVENQNNINLSTYSSKNKLLSNYEYTWMYFLLLFTAWLKSSPNFHHMMQWLIWCTRWCLEGGFWYSINNLWHFSPRSPS